MTAPKPNAELAYRVLDVIDADPKSWDQSWWFTLDEEADCGTAACFAGWACKLSGDQPDPQRVAEGYSWISDVLVAGGATYARAAERAQDLLDISEDDRTFLFSPSNTREDLGRLVGEIFGPRPQSCRYPLSHPAHDWTLLANDERPDDQAAHCDGVGEDAADFGTGCRCNWLGEGTPEHAPSALCRSLRPDADRVEMQPPRCSDHETSELSCPVCTAQRRAFYAALGREDLPGGDS